MISATTLIRAILDVTKWSTTMVAILSQQITKGKVDQRLRNNYTSQSNKTFKLPSIVYITTMNPSFNSNFYFKKTYITTTQFPVNLNWEDSDHNQCKYCKAVRMRVPVGRANFWNVILISVHLYRLPWGFQRLSFFSIPVYHHLKLLMLVRCGKKKIKKQPFSDYSSDPPALSYNFIGCSNTLKWVQTPI